MMGKLWQLHFTLSSQDEWPEDVFVERPWS